MKEISETSGHRNLQDLSSVTFSQALAAGLTHSDWLDGRMTGPSGRDRALASHSVSPEKAQALPMKGTYGLLFDGSSPSADLPQFLESRLRALTDVNGSPEYVLTWKRWDMKSGPPIIALRARRESGRNEKDETGSITEAGGNSGLGKPNGSRSQPREQAAEVARHGSATESAGSDSGVADAGCFGQAVSKKQTTGREQYSPFDDFYLIPCADGKQRRVGKRLCSLDDGLSERMAGVRTLTPLTKDDPQRVGKLKAYGNSICVPIAVKFIIASMEVINEKSV